jgi:DNA polymerase I
MSAPKGTLIFDIETHDGDLLYTLPPSEFVRLIGYKWMGKDEVHLTEDLEEIRARILSARWIIGHNIHVFDLRAVFGIKSNIPMELADQGRTYDTWPHAVLVNPAPATYVDRFGKAARAVKPAEMLKWFGLDEQAHQLGVQGKTQNLKDLAFKYGPEEAGKTERIRQGFGMIPTDDSEYRDYLKGDVLASEAVAQKLLAKGPLNAYALREQRKQSRIAVIESNGFRVDTDRAHLRILELKARRDVILTSLQENYGFPTEGKSPWATTQGKEAIFKALEDHGISPSTVDNWERTATGNLSLGGEVLVNLTKGTPAEDIGLALAELKGQRSLAQLALDSTYPDGFAHPSITMLQRSGRSSTTKPGLTVWTARGPGAVEKSYFLPDSDDEVLLEIDLSNADARNVACISGDDQYAVRFQPGQDGHMINAIAAWGEKTVMASDDTKKKYRQMAKPLGHGWGYGGRANTLSRQTGTPLEDAKRFVNGMDSAYKKVVAWQNRVRYEATKTGHVVNYWGRRMVVEPGREFTQAPALIGQSMTAELIWDGILSMPFSAVRRIKAMVHDALVFSVPKNRFEESKNFLAECMTFSLNPQRGLKMEFPVDCGPPGTNWYTAGH